MPNYHLTRGLFAAALSVWSSASFADSLDNSLSLSGQPKVFMIVDKVGGADTLQYIETAVVSELNDTYG